MKQELSLIMTCYNEEPFIEKSVLIVRDLLEKNNYKYEIIFIDDGSTDNTAKIGEKLAKKYKTIKFFKNEKNLGRGASVKKGIKIARYNYVGFLDTDLELSPIYIPKFIQALNQGYDVVTYLRKYEINRVGFMRWFVGRAYSYLVRIVLNIKLKDTETGFKFFNKERVLPSLNQTKDNHWFWDTEIMALSYYNKLKIKEIKLNYTPNKQHGSKVKIFEDGLTYFKKLIKFRLRR